MPVTCQDIINRAIRKARIPGNVDDITLEEADDYLDELRNLYEQWAANGMFGRLTDVMTNADYEANPNERIRVTDGATVTIPTEFADDGEDYPPYDTALVEVVDVDAQTVTRHLYDAGSWVDISTLTLNDEAPLASKGRGGLAACLAMAIADEFGSEVGPNVARQAASFKMGLALKLGGDAVRTAPDYF